MRRFYPSTYSINPKVGLDFQLVRAVVPRVGFVVYDNHQKRIANKMASADSGLWWDVELKLGSHRPLLASLELTSNPTLSQDLPGRR